MCVVKLPLQLIAKDTVNITNIPTHYFIDTSISIILHLEGERGESGHATHVERGTVTVSEDISAVKYQVSSPLTNALYSVGVFVWILLSRIPDICYDLRHLIICVPTNVNCIGYDRG